MMFSNLNAPPTMGMGMGANMPPNMAPNVAPMPTYTAPSYGYGCGYAAPVYDGCRNDFILIVVLFILLIIVGASVRGYSKC